MGTHGNCFQDKLALSLGQKKPLKESKAQLPYLGNAHLSLGPFKVCIYIYRYRKKLWAVQRPHDTNSFSRNSLIPLPPSICEGLYIIYCFHKPSAENLTTKFILSICSLIKFKDN